MSLPPSFWIGAAVDFAVLGALAGLPRGSVRSGFGVGLFLAGPVAVVTVTCSGGGTLPTLAVGLLGWAAVAAARGFGAGPKVTGIAAVLLVPAVLAADVWQYRARVWAPWRAEVSAARERYPILSRDELLLRPAPDRGRTPPEVLEDRWPRFGGDIDRRYSDFDDEGAGQRHRALTQLHGVHTAFAERFAMRPGFGRLRMGPEPDFSLLLEDRVIPTFPQPGTGMIASDGDLLRGAVPDPADAEALAAWHAERGADFANAEGFGMLVGDEPGSWQNVSFPPDTDPTDAPFLLGFRPHATQTPAGAGPLAPAWELRTVELIGLVQYDEPVGYASPDLPRMGETATHHVRTLTEFERSALPRLAGGEWVVAAADADRLRAVGALPAAKVCAACHGVEEGRLLGALSYDFARSNGGE